MKNREIWKQHNQKTLHIHVVFTNSSVHIAKIYAHSGQKSTHTLAKDLAKNAVNN